MFNVPISSEYRLYVRFHVGIWSGCTLYTVHCTYVHTYIHPYTHPYIVLANVDVRCDTVRGARCWRGWLVGGLGKYLHEVGRWGKVDWRVVMDGRLGMGVWLVVGEDLDLEGGWYLRIYWVWGSHTITTHRTVKKVGGWWWLGTCEVGDGGASGYFQFGTEGKSFVRVLFELWCGGDLHLAVRARC